MYETRLQHALSRMNHHIHPVVNAETGERRPLPSCQPKGKPKQCKADFPLDNMLTDVPLFVCHCVATQKTLPTHGPRSLLGTVLPERNDPWLNAGPRAWIAFAADNGDLKFPFRVPILKETCEGHRIFDLKHSACTTASSNFTLQRDLQMGMAVAAGYFGGYSSKMQEIGAAEVKRLRTTLERKIAGEPAEKPSGLPKIFSQIG